ncbi:MAG: hypothetical protein JJT95_07485 [Pararhodobacter sp.]|nr:hypothetical protein [Pararhodobacter sp.]
MKPAHDAVETLSRLMEEERRALLAGDTPAFDRIARRKDAALARLTAALDDTPALVSGQPGAADDTALTDALKDLRGNAARSRDLLAAALEGMRDAQALLAALREMRHDTYTADGGRERHGAPAGRLERRA